MPVVKSLNLGEDNEKAYDDLIVAVEASDEVLSLLLTVCDEPKLRDEIIQRYEAELQPSIRPYQVLLSRKEPSLREAIAEVFKNDTYLQSGGRAVITVTGADRLLSRRLGEERSEKEIFFGYLQWTRESLREYPYPIILWLTNPLLIELSRKAPDFWSWRKDVFRFKSLPNGQYIQRVYGGSAVQISDPNSPVFTGDISGGTFHFSFPNVSPKRDFPSSVGKRPLPPETIENTSISLEDLQQLIDQTEQQRGNEPLLATLYSQLGRAYASQVKQGEVEASQAKIEQAIEWFQKAARVQEALEIIVDFAKNLSWLGYLYELKGDYVDAEPILQQALTILEQQLGANHPSVARTLHNLSVSYVLQGRYAEVTSLLKQKSLSIPNNLPYSGTPRFIGREAELAQLHKQLQRNDHIAISAIAGLGGIGKTELALQYAYQELALQTYPGGICWVGARQDVGTQILAFARSYLALEIPEDLDLVNQVHWCWRHWSQGEVLVIFDDVTDYNAIQPFLPLSDPRFKVLLTTRLRLERPLNQLILEVLPEMAALEFLGSIVGAERINHQLEDAQALCAWLGCLPLALELAARYLASKSDLSVANLLDRLQIQSLAARALERPEVGMTASLSVASAFELSWQQLSESAQQLAGWLSLFALAPIPWELVEACISELDVETLKDLGNELIKLSLLLRIGEQTYQLHPLIREFFAAKLQQMTREGSMKQAFCREMVAAAKQIPAIPTLQLLQAIASVIPHIAEAAKTLEPWLTDDDLIIPYIGISRFYQGQAAYEQALPWLEQCLHIAETRLGSDHPYVATSLNNLAYLYQLQGRYSEAELLYVRSLQIREEQLGADHPNTAQSLNNLAELYRAMGRYGEAEPLLVRSIQITEQQLGAEHPDTALSLNNLAALYESQGRYSEAEPLYMQSVQIRERQLGADHPEVATSLSNLAELYKSQGRYAQAEPLLLRSLSISEQQLGSDHPLTATILNNLAALYYEQGNYSGAEPLYERSLAVREQQLGAEHPDVATSLNNLAYLYQSQGRYGEAEPLLLRALQIYETQLGSDHPSTASSLNNLAELYLAMGRYGETEPLLLRALQIYETQLGSDHPSTASSLNNLAELYLVMGRYGEAESLLLRSLMIREQQLGTDHPATAMSLNDLANLYYHQNRFSEAEALLIRALAIRERILGSNHPDTLDTQKLLTRLRQIMDTKSEPDNMDELAVPGNDMPKATQYNNALERTDR